MNVQGGARAKLVKKYVNMADAFHAMKKAKYGGQALYQEGLRGGVDTRTYEKHMAMLKKRHDDAQKRLAFTHHDLKHTLDSLLPLA